MIEWGEVDAPNEAVPARNNANNVNAACEFEFMVQLNLGGGETGPYGP
jgi:hypothetical protein